MLIYGQNIDVLTYQLKDELPKTDEKKSTAYADSPEKDFIKESCDRAKRNVRRLILSNYGQYNQKSKYIVLTKVENWGLTEANHYFKKFVLRINYQLNIDLKYLVVPEFQERGSVHYNLVTFNFPFLNKVYSRTRDIWGGDRLTLDVINGFRDTEGVVRYITKYITKQMTDERFKNRKRYFTSRGLYKPIEYRDEVGIEMTLQILRNQLQPVRSEYLIPYIGEVKSESYRLPDDGFNMPDYVKSALPQSALPPSSVFRLSTKELEINRECF